MRPLDWIGLDNIGSLYQPSEDVAVLQLRSLLINLFRRTTLEQRMLLACVSGSSTMQFRECVHVAFDVCFCFTLCHNLFRQYGVTQFRHGMTSETCTEMHFGSRAQWSA